MSEHRAGVAALLGRPNVGKSTLLNRLLGRKLAIVTAKPQTTRSRILGVSTLPGAQILWMDTPGLLGDSARLRLAARRASPGLPGGKPLNRLLDGIARAAAEDCDVALLLVDPARGGLDPELEMLRDELHGRRKGVLVIATKADLHAPPAAARGADLRISARTGEGIDALVAAVVARLPVAPAYYDDPEQLTDRPLRWLAAECVREVVFEELAEELPYATAVEVEAFDESRPELVRIRAQLLVERPSQKRIVVGAGGAQVKRIGTRAREALEALLETRVHLELWVKVEPDWARRPRRLGALGYR